MAEGFRVKLFPLWTLFFNLKAERWWKIDTGSLRWKRWASSSPCLTPHHPHQQPSSSIFRKYNIIAFNLQFYLLLNRTEKSFNGKIVSFRRWMEVKDDVKWTCIHFHNWLNLNLSCLLAEILNTCLCFHDIWLFLTRSAKISLSSLLVFAFVQLTIQQEWGSETCHTQQAVVVA